MSQEVPTVDFCDLLKNPLPHDGQVIKIDGSLGRFRDYVTFYDPQCIPKHPLINVVFAPDLEYDHDSNSGARLGEIVSGTEGAREGNIHIFVSAVGAFNVIPSNRRKDFTELQYEFTVTRIAQIRAKETGSTVHLIQK
jgi:hypothetical protein